MIITTIVTVTEKLFRSIYDDRNKKPTTKII
jgi:hypothetical protein